MIGAIAAATVSVAMAHGVANSAEAPASAAITCDTDSSGKDAGFYDGKSASYKYDERFTQAPEIPKAELDGHTPQGAATWSNWDGKGNDLLLVAAYGANGADAHLIGIDPSGKHVGTVAIAESHVGGITVSNGWAFVQGRNTDKWETIRKYRLSDLKTAMSGEGTPHLKQVGTARNVYGADFMSSHDGYLWAGRFSGERNKMYSYKINDDGSLTTQDQAYEVPAKTQGLLVTKGHFVYATSHGRDMRSNVYVVGRGEPVLDKAKLHCFRAPSMTEGITEQNGNAYLVFESGSHVYRDDPKTLNVIPGMHKAKVSDLTSLVG